MKMHVSLNVLRVVVKFILYFICTTSTTGDFRCSVILRYEILHVYIFQMWPDDKQLTILEIYLDNVIEKVVTNWKHEVEV